MNQTQTLNSPRINRNRAQRRAEKREPWLLAAGLIGFLLLTGVAGKLSQDLGLM